MNAPSMLSAASRQWANRPADERFLDLHELEDKVSLARFHSREKVVSSKAFEFIADPDDMRGGLLVQGQNGTPARMTHWSFGQMAHLAGAPAGYLRGRPGPLAADCLNFGMRYERDGKDVGVLLHKPGLAMPELRAATGPRYGRIWNSDILKALIAKFGDGRTGDFRVPGEFGKAVDVTRENTTIYGSDRDMFVFLADEENRIVVPNRRNGQPGSLARGFFIWNSEVGDKTFGVAMFTFDYVCQNRNVWGVGDYKKFTLRHTVSAPDKFIGEVAPLLNAYAKSSAVPMQEAIAAAQAAKIDDDIDTFLKNRKFTEAQISGAKDAHTAEEGRPIETLWDASVAVSAYARRIVWQDERVDMERKAGAFLELAAA